MKLVMQLLKEAGADTDRAFTVVPSFGGYFKAVKGVEEYGEECICLVTASGRLTLCGKNLKIEKYSEQDMYVTGDIRSVNIE